ncbi:hypothetical protein BJV74DRAFT_849661 [Russula compacta]|nr:hypothetical protein BJV74DRAFT_849661 [Russula compacta]
MPTRGLRPSLARTHSRSSSGASSKVVLNLQLTSKDPVQSKIDKARRTSHTLEPTARANVSRTGKQVTGGAAPRRGVNTHPSRGGKLRAGFTIASSTAGSDDEDAWVSSESGAATPLHDASGDEASGKKTPKEPSPTTPVDPAGQQAKGQNPAFVPSTTPRAEPALPRPRVRTNGFAPTRLPHVAAPAAPIPPTSEPSQQPQQEWDDYCLQAKQPHPQPVTAHSHHPRHRSTLSRILDHPLSPKSLPRTPEAVPLVSAARTEPPTPTSPRSDNDNYAGGRPRPSSTRSFIADHALRPHPLIRGQSFGHGHLAPLMAQLSSSPPPGCATSTSPTSIRTVHTPMQTPSPGKHFPNAIFRRPSTSSAHSVATLPLTPVERGRAISMLSTASASSSAAVSSLAHLPTRAATATPPNAPLVVHFPPQGPHAHPETSHALLPPPYWRSPICESHDRVAHARESPRRRRGT